MPFNRTPIRPDEKGDDDYDERVCLREREGEFDLHSPSKLNWMRKDELRGVIARATDALISK